MDLGHAGFLLSADIGSEQCKKAAHLVANSYGNSRSGNVKHGGKSVMVRFFGGVLLDMDIFRGPNTS